MSEITVKYDSNILSPTPLVERSLQFIDYGSRWGQIEQINLSCYVTGITTYAAAIQSVNTVFANQFRLLEVYSDTTLVYSWDKIAVQEISFPESSFGVGTITPYSVKLLAYEVPSGVLDPTNEYSFSQNSDGNVSVNHKISAKGIKSSNGGLTNAINFVSLFTGQNPFTYCAPAFIPNSNAVLFSLSESIDRAACSYSVNEVYKYVTGQTKAYLETKNLTIDESRNNDYVNLDLNIKWQGSPITKNLSTLITDASALDLPSQLQGFGITTAKVYQNTFSITQDSGQNSIDIRASFISGTDTDLSGYFDYSVSMDTDEITSQSSWRLDGEYLSKGPISFRQSQISAFKTANQAGGYIPYISTLITASPLYTTYGHYAINTNSAQVSISENTGMGQFKISASMSDKDMLQNFAETQYNIDIEPSRWIFELMPSANIEGHYVLQDLQMKNQAKAKFSLNASTTGTLTGDLTTVYSILNTLSGIYMDTGFMNSQSVSSGLFDLSVELGVLGHNIVGSSLLNSKLYGSVSKPYVRKQGFNFGY